MGNEVELLLNELKVVHMLQAMHENHLKEVAECLKSYLKDENSMKTWILLDLADAARPELHDYAEEIERKIINKSNVVAGPVGREIV